MTPYLNEQLGCEGSMSQHYTLEKLRDFFHAHEPFQLARIDDGRIQLHLTDEQYSVIRSALSATQPAQAAQSEPVRPTCAVRGLVAKGGMCSRIIGGKHCGSDEPCQHKQAAQGAGEVVAFRGPSKWTEEEIDDGYRGVRWVNQEGVHGRPSEEDYARDLQRRGIAFPTPAQPAPVVPEGWKLVPVEPTKEMLASVAWPECAKTDWNHMLAATPAPPAKAPEFDRARETSRRQSAVETLLSIGLTWRDGKWCGPAQAAADARDAGRYRLVRRGQHWSVINGIGDTLRGDALDAAADAALATHQQRQDGGAPG